MKQTVSIPVKLKIESVYSKRQVRKIKEAGINFKGIEHKAFIQLIDEGESLCSYKTRSRRIHKYKSKLLNLLTLLGAKRGVDYKIVGEGSLKVYNQTIILTNKGRGRFGGNRVKVYSEVLAEINRKNELYLESVKLKEEIKSKRRN